MNIPAYSRDRCSVCGRTARVHVGTLAYCLNCYNHLADYLAEVPSPTNDSYQILVLDPSNKAVEFFIERFSLGVLSQWTAVELVPDDDPRRQWGYEGRRVSILVDVEQVGQEQALDALYAKVQRVVGRASMDERAALPGRTRDTAAHRPGATLWARETGVARISCDADGEKYVVVDGQRLTGEQLLDLLSCYEGFDLYWQIRNDTDDEPDWLQ